MGKYNSVTLDRDRAFDVNSLQELLNQGKSILNQAIDLSKKMEASISAISVIYNEIEKDYKVIDLGIDIARFSKALSNDIYKDTIDRMDATLNKLMDDIPSYDNNLAQSMDNIQEILNSVKGRISELEGLLEAGEVDLSYREFSQKLEEIKADWNEAAENLSEALTEVMNDMLGVSAKAVEYSEDPVNLSTGNFVYDLEDIKIGGEIPLFFHRYYNSKARSKGCLGRCFKHNYESYLEENSEKRKIIVSMGDGQKKTFQRIEDGTYRSLYSAAELLAKEEITMS